MQVERWLSCDNEVRVMITFQCPSCGKEYKVQDEFGGRSTTCRSCRKLMTIPYPAAIPISPISPKLSAPKQHQMKEQGIKKKSFWSAVCKALNTRVDDSPKKSKKKDAALIPCTDCGKEISSNASACPHCGAQTPITKQQMASQERERDWQNILSGIGGITFVVLCAIGWKTFNSPSAHSGVSNNPSIPFINTLTPNANALPPIEIDSSVNRFFMFSDWKRDGGQITCRIKAKTRIDPGLGNLSPVAELYDKDGVRLEEDTFIISSTMSEGEVVEKSIFVLSDKLERTVRIKIRVKRSVF